MRLRPGIGLNGHRRGDVLVGVRGVTGGHAFVVPLPRGARCALPRLPVPPVRSLVLAVLLAAVAVAAGHRAARGIGAQYPRWVGVQCCGLSGIRPVTLWNLEGDETSDSDRLGA